jgi:3-oxoacyl-[acyl-carrier-protein] synthase III
LSKRRTNGSARGPGSSGGISRPRARLTSDLATRAAKAALADAGIDADGIDAIIVATSTPDLTFPSVATMVQAELGMTKGFAYDVQAVCAGFVFALTNANALILTARRSGCW